MGGCGTIQARLVPESWMHIYKETHTAPLMSFCFTEEHSVWSWKRLASGILYKRWTGTQCSGRRRGSRDLPTGLGQAMLRGEQSSMDMTSHLVGCRWWAGREGKSRSSSEETGKFLGPEESGQESMWATLRSQRVLVCPSISILPFPTL